MQQEDRPASQVRRATSQEGSPAPELSKMKKSRTRARRRRIEGSCVSCSPSMEGSTLHYTTGSAEREYISSLDRRRWSCRGHRVRETESYTTGLN
ncbi:hypothetical protein NDU88_003693 [Pleurodeles waltl]|uniref:Uncharacterized protein n=1 Tax=Pleurodeles waltl TaxID=8319 RepID=A0AAV7NIU3_PLEWA|nr:hypothetical protein NDU88_003693 [Pleurodeles waltl]